MICEKLRDAKILIFYKKTRNNEEAHKYKIKRKINQFYIIQWLIVYFPFIIFPILNHIPLWTIQQGNYQMSIYFITIMTFSY